MQSSKFVCKACLAAFRGEKRRIFTPNTLETTSSSQVSTVSTNLSTSRSRTSTPQPYQNQINLRSDRDRAFTGNLTYQRLYTHRHQLRENNQRRRPFSISSSLQRAVLNPRKDEDGKDMNVEITSRASKRLKEIMISESNPDLVLRVQVESGGCHGFQYLMSLTNMSKVDRAEDTVFESGDKDEDEGGGADGGGDGYAARVVMDEPSLELLKGSKVDYTMELIGSQFKISDNPLATSSCGCGTSFDIKA